MSCRNPSSTSDLAACLRDARERTLALVEDLDDAQMIGPRLAIVNPPLWEIGHVTWFQEHWILSHLEKRASLFAGAGAGAEELYNSAAVAHDTRWDLLLPSREQTLGYMRDVLDGVTERLERVPLTEEEIYFHRLALYHEDMHGEALVYTRQTLGLPAPACAPRRTDVHGGGPLEGDVELDGGRFELGAQRNAPFVFDNEQWAHEVELRPFALARAPVTQAQYLAFVADDGYRRRELWSPEGWSWRGSARAEQPVYWKRSSPSAWMRRSFDRWVALEPHLPVIHVNWYEADAYCRWAERRLPSEAEWEFAAARMGGAETARFPWGDEEPDGTRAHLDLASTGCVEVGALACGDTTRGCRQMIGNVWEWCADAFAPYPGFEPGPYAEYSAPWFGTHKVLRGGAFATRSRLLRNTWRNYFTPDRRDILAGFRSASAER